MLGPRMLGWQFLAAGVFLSAATAHAQIPPVKPAPLSSLPSSPHACAIEKSCADVAPALAAEHEPGAALANWLHRYTEFLATKRGFAAALHSGDPAFDALPGYFFERVAPALGSLLEAATATGEIRADISAKDLLHAVAHLCLPVAGEGIAYSQRMVAVLIDGLRYGQNRG